MRWFPLLALLLFLPSLATATTLSGHIYTDTLEQAADVLVTIDTVPGQRLLSKDGTYQFELPPGNYTITLMYAEGSRNETARENVVVQQEGSFTYDLFLLPSFDQEQELYDELGEIDNLPDLGDQQSVWPLPTLLGIILALILFLIVLYYKLRQHFEVEDDRIEEILAIILKEGGRISQKELRKRVPESEAKVSLMIAELEAKGKVEKIKKGRGNILVAKK